MKPFLLSGVFLLSAFYGYTQAGVEGAPVTLKVNPRIVPVGQSVTLDGNVVITDKVQTVSLTIKTPGGKTESLSATTNLKGDFTQQYKNTQQPGWYAVEALAKDGKGKDTDSFYVAAPAAVASAYKNRLNALQTLAYKNIDAVLNKFNAMDSDPGLEANKEKLKQARQKLGELRGKTEDMSQAFGKMLSEVNTVPGSAGPMQAHQQKLNDWQQEADRQIPELENKIENFENVSTTCETYNTLIEVCNLISWIMNFQGKFSKILINIASDKVLPGAVERVDFPGSDVEKIHKKTAINESQKAMTAAALGFDELKDFISKGLVVDVVQYVTKVLYAQKCVDLKGPANAKLSVEFRNNGSLWWTYKLDLTGNLVLRYEKSADLTKPSIITGEFEGYRTKYEFWEDIEKIEPFPRNMILIKRIRRSPVPINASAISDDLGLAGRTLVPGAYRVKVQGKIVNNTLTLEVIQSPFDYAESVEKNKMILIMAPLVLPVPMVQTFDFPIAKSKVAFSVGLGNGTSLNLQKTGEKLRVKQTVTNTKEPSADAKATSTISFNLSN